MFLGRAWGRRWPKLYRNGGRHFYCLETMIGRVIEPVLDGIRSLRRLA
jgi:hypothetical protein